MNNMHVFFNRLCHSRIPCVTVVILLALAWSSAALCGEIHDAAKNGDVAKVKALLKGDPDLAFSKSNNHGATPLHWAAANGHKDVVEVLLAHGAYVNAKKNDGATPLYVAAQEGHKDVVEVLLAHGADVNAKCDYGTPLYVAAQNGHKDVVEVLLANKAEVNAKDNKNGATPLNLAAQNGHKEVADKVINPRQYEYVARMLARNPKVGIVVPTGTPADVTPDNVTALQTFVLKGGFACKITMPTGLLRDSILSSRIVGFTSSANGWMFILEGGKTEYLDK